MNDAHELTHAQLADLVNHIVSLLYLDTDDTGRTYLNPEKEWDADTCVRVAEELANLDLVPTHNVL